MNGLFKLKDLELGYCLTTNAFQGHTIDGLVNIHEFEKMSREGQYVAFSRVRDLSQIRMDSGSISRKRKRSEYSCKYPQVPLKKLKEEEIYEYSDELQKYYVGHTCDGKKRDAGHHVKPKMKNPDRTVLRTMVGSKWKVERVEKQYILHYRGMYGDNLLNKTYMNIEDIPDAPVINDLRYVPAIVPEITQTKRPRISG